MQARDKQFRSEVAALARRVRAGELTFHEFVERAVPPDNSADDDQVDELIDLLEHEPSTEGSTAVSAEDHARYVAEVDWLIEQLESSE